MIIVHDFSPLLPKAVLVTHDNIIVSTREKGDAFPLTKHSRRQTVVLDQTGKQKVNLIEYDKQNKRLFTLISTLKTDTTRSMYGIDNLSDDDLGQVVKVEHKKINQSMKEIHKLTKNFISVL